MSTQTYPGLLRSCSMSLELSDRMGHSRKSCPDKAAGGSEDSICSGTWFNQLHCRVQFRRTLYTIQLSCVGHEPQASSMAPVIPAFGVSLETGLKLRPR